jgi:large repetitive protein
MKKGFINIRAIGLRALVGSFALLALLSFVLPQAAQARTSGGATIYNTVKVTYMSGTTTTFATADVSVTVNTVGAAVTVVNPADHSVNAGGSWTYDYKVISNSNGYDTYTTSARSDTPAGVSAGTYSPLTATVNLWGGIITAASGAGTITIPFGTTSTLTAGTSTVQISGNDYTVTTIAPGAAAYTNGSGNLVAEVPATLTLTPIGLSPVITAGMYAAGSQVGEFKTPTISAGITAGTPLVLGTDGTYKTHFTITAGASPAPSVTTADVTTTVVSPKVEITKTADKANAVTGDVITYTITVTNPHPTASVTSVTLIDPVPPAYTTYVGSSTTLKINAGGAVTQADVGGVSPLVAGLSLGTGGVMAPLEVDVVVFKVTVN